MAAVGAAFGGGGGGGIWWRRHLAVTAVAAFGMAAAAAGPGSRVTFPVAACGRPPSVPAVAGTLKEKSTQAA